MAGVVYCLDAKPVVGQRGGRGIVGAGCSSSPSTTSTTAKSGTATTVKSGTGDHGEG